MIIFKGALAMDKSQAKIYKLHCENLDAVKVLLTVVEGDLNQLLSYNPEEMGKIIHNYQLHLSFLTGAYIENLYYQLVYKPNFTPEDRAATFVESTEINFEERWQILLEYSFKKGYKINIYEDLSKELDSISHKFYTELHKFLKVELHNLSVVRDSVTHGQFIHSFNPTSSSIHPVTQDVIDSQDLPTIKLRIKQFNLIAKIILELATTPDIFFKNFDNYFNIYDSLTHAFSSDK